MTKNSNKQTTKSTHSTTKIDTRDGRENRNDIRVSPTSKRILEEITEERWNVMRELANR